MYSEGKNIWSPADFVRLTKKWSVYNFNGRFIWTVRDRITTTKIQHFHPVLLWIIGKLQTGLCFLEQGDLAGTTGFQLPIAFLVTMVPAALRSLTRSSRVVLGCLYSTLCILSMCMCILHIVFCTVCKYVLSICKLFLFFALFGARSQEFHSPRHLCCGDVTIKVIWFDLIWFDSSPFSWSLKLHEVRSCMEPQSEGDW